MRTIFYLFLVVFLLPSCNDKKADSTQDTSTENGISKPARKDSIYYVGKYPSGRAKDMGWKVKGLKAGTWKHYNEDVMLASVTYFYKGRKEADLDTADFNTKSITRKHVTVDVPKLWTVSDNEQFLLIATKPEDRISGFSPVFTITKMADPPADAMKAYGDGTVTELQKEHPELKLLQSRSLNINGHEAYEVLALMRTRMADVGYIGTYIRNGDTMYLVTCMAEDGGKKHFLKYLGVFNEMTESITFKSSY